MLAKVAGILGHTILDGLTKGKAVSKEDIPKSFSSITPSWLTQVLCIGVAGAKVEGFQLLEGDSGSTNRQRISVRYNAIGESAKLPTTLFAKAAMSFTNRMSAGATGSMLCECEFYTQVRPKLDIEAPVAVFANYDVKSCAAIILLIDLAETSGGRFCDPTTTYIDRGLAEKMVDLLANVHARYLGQFDAADVAILPMWEDLFALISRIAMISRYGNKGLMAAADVVPAAILRRAKDVWPATLKATENGRREPHALTHGDVHIKNWYITNAMGMGLADWQTAARGPIVRDLAYALACALTPEDRRRWERDLIKRYLDELHLRSGTRLSFDATFIAYRQQMLSALALWTPTLTPPPYMPMMQPKEVSREYIRRITQAMDDLDSLDATLRG